MFDEPIKNNSQKPLTKFSLKVLAIVYGALFLVLSLFISSAIVSHFSYKNAQKKDFKEKWDSFTTRITGNASMSLSEDGVIGDEFASYLYWIPAVSENISSIGLFDSEGKSIYSAGENVLSNNIIENYVKSSLSGEKQLLTPDESHSEYTVICYPITSGENIAAVLLLTVDEAPLFTNPKSAFSGYILIFFIALTLSLLLSGVFAYKAIRLNVIKREIISAKTEAFKLISDLDDFNENLKKVFSKISDLLDAERSTLLLFNYQTNNLSSLFEYSSGALKEEFENTDIYTDDLRYRSVEDNRILYISYSESGRVELYEDLPDGPNPAGMIIPLRSGSEMSGVWEITFDSGKRLSKKFIECKNIADYLAVAINSVLGTKQLSEDSATSEYILKMIDLFGAPKNLADSLDIISMKTLELDDILFCRIYKIEENTKQIKLLSEAIKDHELICPQQKKIISLEELPGHKIALLSGQLQSFGPDEIERLNICIDSSGKLTKINCDIIIAPLTYGSQPLGCFVVGVDTITNTSTFYENLFGKLSKYLSPALESALSYERLDNFHVNSKDRSKKKSFNDKIAASRNLARVVVETLNANIFKLTDEINSLNESDQHSDKIRTLAKEISKMERFISNLNDFANPEQPGNHEQLELAQLIRYVEKRIVNDPVLCESIGDNLQIVTRSAGSGQILADPHLIYKILSKILQNSIEASPDGGEIIIESDIKGKMGIISVIDNGCGMLPEIKNFVFDPFFSTKIENGRGLGLTIAYNILSSMGGSIEIESTAKKGTSVRVILPLTDPEQTALFSTKGKNPNRILLTLSDKL